MLDFYREMEQLFVADKILPSQVISTGKCSGEQRLYLASFEDAISLIQKGEGLRLSNPAAAYRIQQRAYEVIVWVQWRKDTWPFSFARHCVVLGLDEDLMRKGMVALYQEYFGEEIVPPRRPLAIRTERRRRVKLQKVAA